MRDSENDTLIFLQKVYFVARIWILITIFALSKRDYFILKQ